MERGATVHSTAQHREGQWRDSGSGQGQGTGDGSTGQQAHYTYAKPFITFLASNAFTQVKKKCL